MNSKGYQGVGGPPTEAGIRNLNKQLPVAARETSTAEFLDLLLKVLREHGWIITPPKKEE